MANKRFKTEFFLPILIGVHFVFRHGFVGYALNLSAILKCTGASSNLRLITTNTTNNNEGNNYSFHKAKLY